MPFNLLSEKWLPVRRASGVVDFIAPWELTDGQDPPLELALPRPDFQAAMHEFLIGLVQTALPPKDKREWKSRLKTPPETEELRTAMRPYEEFFNLFGPRPRFMQDLEMGEGQPKDRLSVVNLLMTLPGGSTFFDKSDQTEIFCPACAAMSLYTLQTFAPSGGRGHRTSLRGGGPLSTPVMGENLWENVWLNVLHLKGRSDEATPDVDGLAGAVFPWAAPTRTSEKKGSEFYPKQGHFLHNYWAMPRRILLFDEELESAAVCGLCGAQTSRAVRQYATRPFGYNYADDWRHPLTPYRYQGQDKPTLAVKGRANITGYSNWLGLIYGEGDNNKKVLPALCVSNYRKIMRGGSVVMASGYDMSNMKPVQMCEGRMPVYEIEKKNSEDEEMQDDLPENFRSSVEAMVAAADQVRRNLLAALKEALFSDGGRNVQVGQSLLENVSNRFWGDTEPEFYRLVEPLSRDLSDEKALSVRTEWADILKKEVAGLFAQEAESTLMLAKQAERISKAKRKMFNFNRKKMEEIMELEINDARDTA